MEINTTVHINNTLKVNKREIIQENKKLSKEIKILNTNLIKLNENKIKNYSQTLIM